MAHNQTLTTFHLFPTLPSELQRQIFEEAILQSPRIVEICQKRRIIRASHHGDDASEDENGSETHESESVIVPAFEGVPFEDDYEALISAMEDEESEESSDSENLRAQNLVNAAEEAEAEDEGEEEEEDPTHLQDLQAINLAASSREAEEGGESNAGDDDDEASSEEGHSFTHSVTPPNPNPFYTTTPLPPLLHTSRLARSIALAHYTLSFPNPHCASDQTPTPTIYYNPRIDTLYFPEWCFPYQLTEFEATLSLQVKATISSIAIGNLMWFSTWQKGSVNCMLQIDDFMNVRELILVGRESGKECACCMTFEGPEEGVVGFEEVEPVGRQYEEKCLKDCETEFSNIKERVEGWNVPKGVRFVRLFRDGVRV